MGDAEIIERTSQFVKEKFNDEGSGHDWSHMYRVWQLSKRIAESESNIDMTVVELGALLHDIADWKFYDGDEEAGPREARSWLKSIDVSEDTTKQVEHIVASISFHSRLNKEAPELSLEAQIVHDADKLDAIGAIGVARTFAYSGAKGRPMYDPDVKPGTFTSSKEYRNVSEKNTTINHFYEKLLLLKDMMLTETGKQLAQHRHEYMEQFLTEFYAEWDGKK